MAPEIWWQSSGGSSGKSARPDNMVMYARSYQCTGSGCHVARSDCAGLGCQIQAYGFRVAYGYMQVRGARPMHWIAPMG